MKTFDVKDSTTSNGIEVVSTPYPHVVLGQGGNKKATWVSVGKRDVPQIVREGKIANVGVIALKDESKQPTGKFLIVAPQNGNDNRVLVLWRVESGYRGSASIEAGKDVVVLGSDVAWHSGRGNLGETAEMLAVLKPGQELTATISGRRVENTRARLTWDGRKINVEFGDDSLFDVEEAQGDYV